MHMNKLRCYKEKGYGLHMCCAAETIVCQYVAVLEFMTLDCESCSFWTCGQTCQEHDMVLVRLGCIRMIENP